MPRPFAVDPAVLARVRPMQARDAGRVAELHHAAMGDSLWARLGRPFLRELYLGLIDDPRFLAFVYEEEVDGARRIRGFIAGTLDGAAMIAAVFRRRWVTLGAAAALGVARSPRVLAPLLETARYFSASADEELEIPAESMFCSFEPELRGKRVSGHVNKVLFDELLARGHRYVKITTEVDNEGAVRQLRSWGFEERGTFRFYEKVMVRYVLDLQASERVEPLSRHPAV